MHILWYGLSSFKIISKDLVIFTDPFGKSSGLTPPRGAAQIVISSDPDNELHNNFSSISGEPIIIERPGEYDIQGAFIKGVPTVAEPDKKTLINRRGIFSILIEGITIGFLGNFSAKELTDTQVEDLNDVDILLVPIGSNGVCDAKTASAIINQIEPKIVIPAHYKTPGFTVKLDPIDRFLKEMGGKEEEMEKLVIKKADLEEEKTKLVVLEPQRN